jgi:hypothetical protein
MSSTSQAQESNAMLHGSYGDEGSSGPGAVIRIADAKPRPKSTKKVKKTKHSGKPKSNGGSQNVDHWTAKPASDTGEQPAAQGTESQQETKNRGRHAGTVRSVQELQRHLDSLRTAYTDVYAVFASELAEEDPAAAHIMTQNVQESVDFFVKRKKIKFTRALAIVGFKLTMVEELLREYAPIIRSRRERSKAQYEQQVTDLENRRLSIVGGLEGSSKKEFLLWLRLRKEGQHISLMQPAESSISYRVGKRELSPDKAIISLSRQYDNVEQSVIEFDGTVRSLHQRWNRVHEEHSWIVKALKGVTRHAYESSFEEAFERWGFDAVVRTLDAAEMVADSKSVPFISVNAGKKGGRKGRTPGQIERAQEAAEKRRKQPNRSADGNKTGHSKNK